MTEKMTKTIGSARSRSDSGIKKSNILFLIVGARLVQAHSKLDVN